MDPRVAGVDACAQVLEQLHQAKIAAVKVLVQRLRAAFATN